MKLTITLAALTALPILVGCQLKETSMDYFHNESEVMTFKGENHDASLHFMSSLLDDILKFLSGDLFRILVRLFAYALDLIGMDASTFWMIVLGIAGSWGVYWVVQQFLD